VQKIPYSPIFFLLSTKDLPAERPRERREAFEALFSNGTVSNGRIVGGYDLFDFSPTDYPDFTLPGDYGGASGGAVWRIYLRGSMGH
jgi:hypothetical protein